MAMRPWSISLEKTDTPTCEGSSVISPFCSFSRGSYTTSNFEPTQGGSLSSATERRCGCQVREVLGDDGVTKHYLTCSLLRLLYEFVPSGPFSIAMRYLIPPMQVQNRDHKLSYIKGIREGHWLISCTGNAGLLVHHVDNKRHGCHIGFQGRRAVVVEKETVVETRPLQLGLTELH